MLNSISKFTQIKVFKNVKNTAFKFQQNITKAIVSVNEDYTRLWNNMKENIGLLKYDKLCPGQGSFGHLINYDAGYYG